VNRVALACYRRGAERPEALDPSLVSSGGYLQLDAIRPIQRLALMFGTSERDAVRELADHQRIIAAAHGQEGTTARGRGARHTTLEGVARKRAAH
jgi:hypothetical protein